jgi:hypothetical protein
MLKLKSKILLSATVICSLIIFNSCSNEDNSITEENQIINDTNLELLKASAHSTFITNDFSKIIQPYVNTTNYEGIIEVLNNTQNRNTNSNTLNFEDYEDVLGEYYDEEYFNQLQQLFEHSTNLIQSDLFNESSTIEEREPYLVEVLEYAILTNTDSNLANRSSSCGSHRTVCENGAERTLGITIAGCTAGSVVAAILTAGAGAAAWPVCMATAGFHYDSNMQTCQGHYDVCVGE